MKILIVEDEIPAQVQLERLICMCYPDFEIVGKITSVKSAVEWLATQTADLIFMDVELSDGVCFEIFNQVEVTAQVIITTAYDNYAVKAFKVNSIDYLLKPIGRDDFTDAVTKFLRRKQPSVPFDIEALKQLILPQAKYKQRFTVRLGERIIVLDTADIAYFYAEEKATFMITHENKRYLSDFSLDAIEEQLNPKEFFRLTRGCIAGIRAIGTIAKYSNSRLKVLLQPPYHENILVSRVRIPLFLNWLEGK
ncbi:MAG: LytTR family DNA-binding domain-containing protein [Prevotellaceae bacterium]|jgi:DNA-binding LytR/AlgR family response regulator|nr:LytTR family DNA-binding domain-containing protein [Prevotellaceae bacterium]